MATTTARRPLSFGVKTAPQNTTYEDMLRVWQEADSLPILEHAWLFDHFVPLVRMGNDPTGPCLEGWTLLAALAARTERIRIGQMVTGNTYRHPAVLANMGATVDVISRGRLDFGIGAGWHEGEHAMYGIPLYAPGERIRRLGEACEVVRLLWTEQSATFDGQYYQLTNAVCEPKPVQRPHPPFVIGGSGEQLTLKVVATYADIWNFAGGDVATFVHKQAVLDGHCAAIGRDPAAIQRSIQMMMDPADLAAGREQLRGYIETGATHIILNLRHPYPEGIAHRLADEVAAPLAAEYNPKG
ncbi:MAG TPA: LLM class F420-dependent oxidoreductase [Ktedonobacterales bacterium]|nr:LLM class F420-dependent oxidoreductase [Ktedonobacterales bacterium]